MNKETLSGEVRDIVGKVKETAGDLTGDLRLQGEGLGDQLSGKAQKILGAARDALGGDGEVLIDRALRFVRERPLVTAALAGAVGLGLLYTLRGASPDN